MKKLITLLLVLVTINSYSQSKEEIENYLDTITHYVEGNDNKYIPTKYSEDVKIYVDGDKKPYLITELDKIVVELNDLIEPINISVVNDSSESNVYLFFGNADDFADNLNDSDKWKKHIRKRAKKCNGLFVITTNYNKDYIKHSEVFIDLEAGNSINKEKHTLREEITQCLGLTNDSYKYDDSIFYQLNNEVTKYSKIDKKIIKLFYNE